MLRRLTLLAVGVVALTASAVAAGESYPPADNGLALSGTTAGVGDSVTASAKTFLTGSPVTFTLFSAPIVLGTAPADGSGVANLPFVMPAVELGLHTIEATGTGRDGLPLTVSSQITVVGPAVGGADLPRTGTSSSRPLTQVAVTGIALGGLLLLVARRRLASTG